MSMNLHCNHGVTLIQTPTHITRMCLYADLDKVPRKKSPWKTVMQKYLMWVTDEWGNKLQDWATVERERSRLEAAAKQYKKLKFTEV